MKFGTKKFGRWFGRGAKKVGNAVNPENVAARAVDKAVDSMKDDELVIEILGVKVGRLYVADKEDQ